MSCRQLGQYTDAPNSSCFNDKLVVPSRRARLDWAKHKIVPLSFTAWVLEQEHNSTIYSLHGARQIDKTMRRSYYWPHMANDVYIYVKRYQTCRKHRKNPTNQRLMQLFLREGQLEFVSMDILGPLPNTKTGNKFIVVMTDHYSILTRAIPTKKTTATDVARVFVESWVRKYGISE